MPGGEDGDQRAARAAPLRRRHLQRREADRAARRAGVVGPRDAGHRDDSGGGHSKHAAYRNATAVCRARTDGRSWSNRWPRTAGGDVAGCIREGTPFDKLRARARRRARSRASATGRPISRSRNSRHRRQRHAGRGRSHGASRGAAGLERDAAEEQTAKFARQDESQTVRFQVKPAAGDGTRRVPRPRGRDGERRERSTRGFQVIEYPHIRRYHIYEAPMRR